jgi:hypothetical protein
MLNADAVKLGPITEMAKLIRMQYFSSLKRKYKVGGSNHEGKIGFLERLTLGIFRL